jgi:outer membrane beta-barrel protein
LRERVKPVSGHLFLKQRRFEVTPSVTVSIKDAFYTKYILGASLTYHPIESIGIGARFGYSLPVISGAAQICESGAGTTTRGCRLPTNGDLNGRAPGQIAWVAGLDLQWAPIYGKIALIAEHFLHFDLYGLAGGAVVQYKGPFREACSDSNGCSTAQISPGGNVGLGMRSHINRWMMVRTEIRDLIYREELTSGAAVRNQLLIEIGFSMFFPMVFNEG